MKLTEKTIAITGGARGIGRAIALALGRQGADLALIDLDPEALATAVAECAALGVRARAYTANVADEASVEAVMARIAEDFGRFDGLINNAGITRDGMLLKVRDGQVVDRLSLSAWQAVLDVNLTGVFLCTRAGAEQMIRAGQGGVIVNLSSVSRAGNLGQSNYSAAKAGVVALTTVWARELARHGIRVGAIAPGFTATDILHTIPAETMDKLLSAVPLRRTGQPEEIAQAAQFIFENDYFTGRCIEVDGGIRL
ncbi:SDR family oxidoreductase [Ideonella sp. B7]|uniref:SDR family oxidoreductase n=1 Tax=Ideonella benzenivorans TaxID=2831643 RepID=UPI001CEC2275|nr:SDR family oxidoreductase [Ideonella benzenivorans]MCA6215818.1 SDR family oxidoreductase [Ideonella benzenivorans]